MLGSRLPLGLLAILYVMLIALLIDSADKLPQLVATHFGFAGDADAWMGRTTYLIFMAGFGLTFPLLLPAVGLALGRLPIRAIKIPHREVWLAPGRRDATLAYFRRQMAWLGVLELAFVIVMHLLVVEANRHRPPRMTNLVWLSLVFFLAVLGVWGWRLVRRFPPPGKHLSSN